MCSPTFASIRRLKIGMRMGRREICSHNVLTSLIFLVITGGLPLRHPCGTPQKRKSSEPTDIFLMRTALDLSMELIIGPMPLFTAPARDRTMVALSPARRQAPTGSPPHRIGLRNARQPASHL